VVLRLPLAQRCDPEQHCAGFGRSPGRSVTALARGGLPLLEQRAVPGTALRRCGSAAPAPAAPLDGASLNLSVPGSTVRHRVALKSLGIIKFYFRSLAPLNSTAKQQLTSQG